MSLTRFDLTGRVAIVIGGTSGIGLSIARGLAEAGADVVPTGRRVGPMEESCAEIKALGRRTLRQTVDATDRASLESLREAVLGLLGAVDILVNSAGWTMKKPTVQVTDEEWNSINQSIFHSTVRACQVFYQPLKQSGRGRVINIASLGSFVSFHEVAPYCAAKSAVLSLTRSLGAEWARDGICVNAIAPGIFPTDLNASLLDDTPRGRELLMRTPMGRFGKPGELVGAALLLASDAASYITGQCITVDGGFLAAGVNT